MVKGISNIANKGQLAMKKKLILLIMEKNQYFDQFKRILEDNEFEVITANDGRTGFELTRDAEPDLILSATQLNKMDGIELCYMIRQNSRLASTPFILIADDDDPEIRINGFRSGVDAIVPSAISNRELCTRIETLIKRYELLTKQTLKANQSIVGKLDDFRLIEILQMLNLNQKTGTLKVHHQNQLGEVGFYEGKITWAHSNGADGQDAVKKMAFWDEGFFIFEKDLIQSETNIQKPTIQLILDCCQQLDESKMNLK
jgi:DNA-binding response OmpR family regulator